MTSNNSRFAVRGPPVSTNCQVELLQGEPVLNTVKLNQWLTLGANFGVLAGLLLLVVELNQNHEMMRSQTRHEMSAGIVDLLQTPANNEQLADLILRAGRGEDLTDVEQFQFELRTNALLRYWEDVHYQYRAGLYDAVEFGKQKEAWKASLSSSVGFRRYWCKVRQLYSPEFMAEMDMLMPAGSCG
jgi:hypothetical protein